MQLAIIKKDINNITANRDVFYVLIIVPLIMTVALPVIFILVILLSPADSADMMKMLKLLESAKIDPAPENTADTLISLYINYMMPLFFLLIPIMVSTVMAASSFVGEKDKKTLETLLYCPLTLKEIFNAKIFASFLLGMAVSVFSFIIMLVVTETLLLILNGAVILPDINWLIMMLLVSPAAALISISLIVRNSAKAKTSEEAQQSCLMLILPVLLLIMGQFTGIMMMGIHIFLILGAAMAVIAVFILKSLFRKFSYETLLR
jgi:ABC-type Na+ efflux pump permease subunit